MLDVIIFILILVALIAIAIVVVHIDTCPYCGSIRLEKKKHSPNHNPIFSPGKWSVRCKKCGAEFYLE